MPMRSLPLPEQAVVRLRHCDDDLQVIGGDGRTLELVTSDDLDTLNELIIEDEQGVVIEGFDESLTLRVPRNITVDVIAQAGTVSITNVQHVRLSRIEDDVRLRMIDGSVEVEHLNADFVVERAGKVTGRGVIEGDVRITSGAQVELAHVDGDLRTIDTPVVRMGHISGDADISSAHEQVVIEAVDGDLKLRDCGASRIGHVIGDLSAVRVHSLQAELVDGDCAFQNEDGRIVLGTINGDLSARVRSTHIQAHEINGDVSIDGARAGVMIDDVQGDLTLRIEPAGNAMYQARVRGDASISLPERCNITVEAQARRGINGLGIGRARKRVDTLSAVLGTGEGRLYVQVNGELAIRGAGASAVTSTVRTPQPARAEVVIGGGYAEAASVTGPTVRLQPGGPDASAADDERLAILRMVANGQIGAEEAEQLLSAIEEQRGASGGQQRAPGLNRTARGGDDAFANLTAAEVIDLKQHGVDRQYISQLRQLGITNLRVPQLIDFKAHDLSPNYIAEIQSLGIPQLTPETWIDLRAHDVKPSYIAALRDAGLRDLTATQVIDLSAHDVTPDFVQAMNALDLPNLSVNDLIDLSAHDVTPEFVRSMRALGIHDLDAPKLIDLKNNGVDEAFVHEIRAKNDTEDNE